MDFSIPGFARGVFWFSAAARRQIAECWSDSYKESHHFTQTESYVKRAKASLFVFSQTHSQMDTNTFSCI